MQNNLTSGPQLSEPTLRDVVIGLQEYILEVEQLLGSPLDADGPAVAQPHVDILTETRNRIINVNHRLQDIITQLRIIG